MSDDFEKRRELKGVVDRVWAGVLGAGAMVITAVLGPLALEMLWRGDAPRYLAFALFSHPAQYVVGTAVFVGVGALAGIMLGTERTITLFGYLWFTERPSRPNFTAMLWLGLAALWAVVYLAVSHAV